MTVRELSQIFNQKIPSSLSCDWDNDGLMCCPDSAREIRRVLLVLDVTKNAVKKAIDENFDLILSHHPFIFKGLSSLTEENHVSAKAIDLIQNGISVMSYHTRLDAVAGGVNDVLAGMLGLCDVTPFGAEGIGRIGTLPEATSAEAFAKTVKKTLGAPVVWLADAGVPVHRVAVLGGNGSDDVTAAKAAGSDTYVSGELKYHQLTDAPEEEINLLAAGHFHTEFPVCEALVSLLGEIDPSIECEIYDTYIIKAI